jgi:hypothetical protein
MGATGLNRGGCLSLRADLRTSAAAIRCAGRLGIDLNSMPVRPALQLMTFPPAYVRKRTEQAVAKADNSISSPRQQFLLLY